MTMTVTTDKKADPADGATAADDESAASAVQPESESVIVTDEADAGLTERSWPRRMLVGGVAVLFIATLALSGYLGWTLWQQRERTQAGQQAQAAAVAYVQILTSIDANKVDENFNQVLDGATGEFKDMYSQSSTQLRQLLIDNKATAHGVVVESAIQSVAKNKVVVLLFVDQSVTNTNVPDPRIDRSRIKMTMEFVDGRWRASHVALP
jgi:Mce-associated membrane protein